MPEIPAIVTEAVKRLDAALDSHRVFVRDYERGERSYWGILTANAEAAKWRHKYSPKYAFNLIETIVSSTVEMGLTMDVRPAPHSQPTLEEATQLIHRADAMNDLLRHEHRVDSMDYLQRPTYLTGALAGYAVLKPAWSYRTQNVPRQVTEIDTIEHPSGLKIDVPMVRSKVVQDVFDHSHTELCDPRDFIPHESARSLNPFEPGGAQCVFHRGWYSFEQLKMLEKSGFLSNVDQLKETQGQNEEYDGREKQLWDITRTKDLIEVVEYWCMEQGQVWRTIIGNRRVLLRDKEANPFSHGGYPFVIVSSMPQPFTIRGASDICLIEELQEMLWEFGNQRLDNAELINNWITLVRKDVDDLEGFEHYPGAFWEVESPDQVQQLQPPYQLIEATMGLEGSIRSDMQNVTSAAPFAGGTMGANAQTTGTATGASIVMNQAQQRMIFKKYQSQQGFKDEATMRLKNCQQFITDRRLLQILGPDGKMTYRDITPYEMQGEFVAELEAMGESNMRQEKRAEALQWAGFLMQSAPVFAASGKPLAVDEVVKWAAKLWGISDVERFFSMQPASMGAMAAPGGTGGAQSADTAPAGPPGITAGSAIDASSPSAAGQIGGSPMEALQRALASGGGVGNQ